MNKNELNKNDIFNEEDILKEETHIELIKIEKKLKNIISDFYKEDEYKRSPSFKEPTCIFGLYDSKNKSNRIGVTFLKVAREDEGTTIYTTDSTVIIYLKRIYDDLLDILDGKDLEKSFYINSVAYSMLHEMVHWYQANYGFYDGTSTDSKGYQYRELLCCNDAYNMCKSIKNNKSLPLLEKLAGCALQEQLEEIKGREKDKK